MRHSGRTPSPDAASRLAGRWLPASRLAGRRLLGTVVTSTLVMVLAGCGARGTTTAPVVLTVEPCASASQAPAVVCSARPIATSTSDEPRKLAAVPRTAGGALTSAPTTTSSVVVIPATNAPTPSLTTPGPASGATSGSTAAAPAPASAPSPTAGAPAAAAAAQAPDPGPAANDPEPAADPAPAPESDVDPSSNDSEPAPPPVKRQPRTTPPPAPPPPVARVGGGVSAQVVQLANAERAKAGLGALTVDSRFASAAAGHSTDQATMNRMDHTGSDGSSMADRINASGFRWRALGENVAVGYQDAASVMSGWMNSAGHRKNILTAGFTVIGVAAAASADGTYYWTMDLGTPG